MSVPTAMSVHCDRETGSGLVEKAGPEKDGDKMST
jgi:hypothetical protein